MNTIGIDMRRTLTHFALVVFLFSAKAAANEARCVSYSDSSAEIAGMISGSKSAYPKAPNSYQYVFFHLHLVRPICISGGADSDGLDKAYDKIETIEIGVTSSAEYRTFRQMIGKGVSCTGRVAPALAGFHWADVVIWGASCTPNNLLGEGNKK